MLARMQKMWKNLKTKALENYMVAEGVRAGWASETKAGEPLAKIQKEDDTHEAQLAKDEGILKQKA